MDTSEERAKILRRVADGKITADEAARLLDALGDGVAGAPEPDEAPPIDPPRFGSLWLAPMIAGLALFVCGALAIFPLYAESGSWLLVACGWPVFVLGLGTMLAGWFARKARWVHVRVTNVDGSRRNVKISFPLPLRLSAWALKIASRFVPQLKDTGVDEMIVALEEGVSGDQPLYVDVQEGDDGERVQVYIG
jgi:hypothetical protein